MANIKLANATVSPTSSDSALTLPQLSVSASESMIRLKQFKSGRYLNVCSARKNKSRKTVSLTTYRGCPISALAQMLHYVMTRWSVIMYSGQSCHTSWSTKPFNIPDSLTIKMRERTLRLKKDKNSKSTTVLMQSSRSKSTTSKKRSSKRDAKYNRQDSKSSESKGTITT